MPGVKLNAKLPDDDGNGLTGIANELVNTPRKTHVVVMTVDSGSIEVDTDTGAKTAKARIRRVEVISDRRDIDIIRQILVRRFEQRTGKAVLPIMLDWDLRVALGEVDPDDDEAPIPGQID